MGLTLIDTSFEAAPASFAARRVYTVLTCGVTATGLVVTVPGVGLMVRLVAPVTSKLKLTVSPSVMSVLSALKLLILGGLFFEQAAPARSAAMKRNLFTAGLRTSPTAP